jgi:hypothetical protein
MTGYAENAAIGNGRLEPGMQVATKPFNLDKLAARYRPSSTALTFPAEQPNILFAREHVMPAPADSPTKTAPRRECERKIK